MSTHNTSCTKCERPSWGDDIDPVGMRLGKKTNHETSCTKSDLDRAKEYVKTLHDDYFKRLEEMEKHLAKHGVSTRLFNWRRCPCLAKHGGKK